MSEPPATQVVHFPSPKSQLLVDMSKYNDEKRLSLSDIITSNNEFENKDAKNSTNFLSSLKSYNIDKPKFSNSLSSNSLDTIMHDSKKSTQSSNKFIIDDFISQILNLPKQSISDESIWPYNVQTLNEVLQFKIEQEKTKQESIKADTCHTSLQLLQLAKSMDLNHDLIASFFMSDENDLIKLKSKLFDLQNSHTNNIPHHHSLSNHLAPNDVQHDSSESKIEYQKSNSYASLNFKRKHSDTQLPSFSETAESIKSNVESPNKLPKSTHRRIASISSTSSSKESRVPSPPANHIQLPTPQQHKSLSPQIPPQLPPNVYQIYYGPPVAESTTNNQPVARQNGSILGSPYSQKYPSVLYQPPPPPPPGSQYQGYVVPQYQYFVPSPTNNPNGTVSHSQYVVKSSPNIVPPQAPPVPSHQFQSTDGDNSKSNIFRPAEIQEDSLHPTKKHKSTTKSTSINFMITTPKNPPARKYNNPNKDKQ